MQESPSKSPGSGLPDAHPIAVALAAMPGVVERLLAAHYPDPQGYCHGCRLPQAGFLKWPCSLVVYARQARALQEAARSLRGRLRRPRSDEEAGGSPAGPVSTRSEGRRIGR